MFVNIIRIMLLSLFTECTRSCSISLRKFWCIRMIILLYNNNCLILQIKCKRRCLTQLLFFLFEFFRSSTRSPCLSFVGSTNPRSIHMRMCTSLIIIVLENMLQYLGIINILDCHRLIILALRALEIIVCKTPFYCAIALKAISVSSSARNGWSTLNQHWSINHFWLGHCSRSILRDIQLIALSLFPREWLVPESDVQLSLAIKSIRDCRD